MNIPDHVSDLFLHQNTQPYKCFVTGGAGFIGSHLCEALVELGCAVTVFDNFSSGNKDNLKSILDKITIVEGDIRDVHALTEALEGVDYVFHLAALCSVFDSINYPILTNDINVTGTLNVLEASRQRDVKKVVIASSAAVYGSSPELPKTEEMHIKAISPYGISKLIGEEYCEMYARFYNLNTVALRFFNVFGPRQSPRSHYSGVISIFTHQVLGGDRPTVYGDGGQSRDFISVYDIVYANLMSALSDTGDFDVFNVAYGKGTTLMDILDGLKTETRRDFSVKFEEERRGDLRHSIANVDKITSKLNYKPVYNFEEAFAEYIRYVQSETHHFSYNAES